MRIITSLILPLVLGSVLACGSAEPPLEPGVSSDALSSGAVASDKPGAEDRTPPPYVYVRDVVATMWLLCGHRTESVIEEWKDLGGGRSVYFVHSLSHPLLGPFLTVQDASNALNATIAALNRKCVTPPPPGDGPQ